MVAILFAAALASTVGTEWSTQSEIIDGKPVCTLQRDFQGGTRITFLAFDPIWKEGHFNLIVENPTWSLHAGDKVGDVNVVAQNYRFSAPVEPDDGFFTIFVNRDALEPFLASASSGGFSISRGNGRSVGSYTDSNLEPASNEFIDCVKVKLGTVDDPFAD